MAQAVEVRAKREPAMFYRRIEIKLGVTPLRSDRDLARLVDERLPLASVESLSHHGISDEEIYSFIVPRRTLVHRKTRQESLTHDESDRAVRIARITSLAEEARSVRRRLQSISVATQSEDPLRGSQSAGDVTYRSRSTTGRRDASAT
jgi:hypothetical protein